MPRCPKLGAVIEPYVIQRVHLCHNGGVLSYGEKGVNNFCLPL